MKKQLLINVLLIVVMLLMAACGVTGKTVVPTQPGQQVVSDRTPVEYYRSMKPYRQSLCRSTRRLPKWGFPITT